MKKRSRNPKQTERTKALEDKLRKHLATHVEIIGLSDEEAKNFKERLVRAVANLDGTSGQDRESYSDDQDRESYNVGE